MLEVFEQAGIRPKPQDDDPGRPATLTIADHGDPGGTGIRREMLDVMPEPGADHLLGREQ